MAPITHVDQIELDAGGMGEPAHVKATAALLAPHTIGAVIGKVELIMHALSSGIKWRHVL